MTPAKLIEKYIQLRNKKKEVEQRHAEELLPYATVMGQIEVELLRHLETTKLDQVKGNAGMAYKYTATSVGVQDWQLALKYIREHQAWDLLEARVAKNATLSVVEDTKKPIPGVKISQAVVLRVRAN